MAVFHFAFVAVRKATYELLKLMRTVHIN